MFSHITAQPAGFVEFGAQRPLRCLCQVVAPQFATRHFHRVGPRFLLPRALGKFPIAALRRVAILLHEVQATTILDRNNNHEIRLLDDAINSS